jgi:hypothetical protein
MEDEENQIRAELSRDCLEITMEKSSMFDNVDSFVALSRENTTIKAVELYPFDGSVQLKWAEQLDSSNSHERVNQAQNKESKRQGSAVGDLNERSIVDLLQRTIEALEVNYSEALTIARFLKDIAREVVF